MPMKPSWLTFLLVDWHLQLSPSRLWMDGSEWLKIGEVTKIVALQMPELCYSDIKKAESFLWLLTISSGTIWHSGSDGSTVCDGFSSFHPIIDIRSLWLKFCRHLQCTSETFWCIPRIVESQKLLVKDSTATSINGRSSSLCFWTSTRFSNVEAESRMLMSAEHPIILHMCERWIRQTYQNGSFLGGGRNST